MLIDAHMPRWEWNEVHAVEIAAPPADVMAAVRGVTAREIRLLRLLMGLRSLPSGLRRGSTRDHAGDRPVLEGMLGSGFALLGEDPGREVVVGIVGRFWQACPVHATIDGAAAFAAFAEAGFAKATMNFTVAPIDGGRTRLVTETRIAATDAAARRRFRAYWTIVRPGSGIIRRMWLRAVKRRAEGARALTACP